MTTHLRDLLRDADPLAVEPDLSADDIRAMRRKVLSRVNVSGARRHEPPTLVVLTIAIAGALVIGVFVGRHLAPPGAKPQTFERRQLQFETSGGTRIIWMLNPDFEL